MTTYVPPPGFPDDDDGSEDGGGPPKRCDFCQRTAHLGACAELTAFVKGMRTRMYGLDTTSKVIAGIVQDAFPIRRSGLEMSLERVVIDGIAIPF
jgi:hypothetical protein